MIREQDAIRLREIYVMTGRPDRADVITAWSGNSPWPFLYFGMAMESEHSEQVKLIQWWGLTCRSFGLPENLLFAIPNGGERNIVVAGKLKAEGVRAGVPDLFLAYPSNGYNGLFIEMKKEKVGRVSSVQKQYIDVLSQAGYYTSVCYGWVEAAECIKKYLR